MGPNSQFVSKYVHFFFTIFNGFNKWFHLFHLFNIFFWCDQSYGTYPLYLFYPVSLFSPVNEVY